ncbi:hypothetical protein [Agrobacterium burrii]
MRNFQKTAFALAMSFAVLPSAQAQTPENNIEIMPDYIARRLELDPFEQVAGGLVDQGFITGSKRWNADEPLQVCFFGGPVSVRRKIAKEWHQADVKVRFDFGDLNNPRLCKRNGYNEIRVGFAHRGYWSLVGQDSIIVYGQHEQSLNLARFDVSPPAQEEFRRIVLHEFGHALGFNHEHQHSLQSCESEFNFGAIYSYLSGPPNNWSRETIDHNMRGRKYHEGDIATQFDPKSIMLYSFPPSFYKNGMQSRCYASRNTTLSTGDKNTFKIAYGDSAARDIEGDLSAIETAAQKLTPDEQKVVSGRLQILRADLGEKEKIIGLVRPEYVDVDLFYCRDQGKSALVTEVSELIATQGAIGRLRNRAVPFPEKLDGEEQRIDIVADQQHPEWAEAQRLAARFEESTNSKVNIVANQGNKSPWLLSIVACE